MTFGHQERNRLAGSHVPSASLEEYLDGNSHRLGLTIVFTTMLATLDAFREAVRLAHELDVHIRILIPYVVPFPLPIASPQVKPEFRFQQLIEYCKHEQVETRIDIRLCRDARNCIHSALLSGSLILVGGRNSWWPLTYEKRLVFALRNAGHKVLFVRRPRAGQASCSRNDPPACFTVPPR